VIQTTQSPIFKNPHFLQSDYRYTFQGMEADDEVKGEGNSVNFEFRMYDPRLGRWLSIDPVFKSHESPYAGFANNPIWFGDLDGADTLICIAAPL
jgi:RHS repeat-associated protein